MAKSKKEEQLALGASAPPPVQTPAASNRPSDFPALVEFSVDGAPWLCKRFDALSAEFGITSEKQLPDFYLIASRNERAWQIVRRLFSIQPVVPPSAWSMDDLRPWTRDELQKALGITRAQLTQELDAVRGGWMAVKAAAPAPDPREARPDPRDAGATRTKSDELPLDADSDYLKKMGFDFKWTSIDERCWFKSRVEDFEKAFNEKGVSGLARNVVLVELNLRRLETAMNDPEKYEPGSELWIKRAKLQAEQTASYNNQLEALLERCPWLGHVAGKYAFRGQVSDITKAIQLYKSRNDTALIDGIFTATEIQVLCRMNQQAPEPQYRAGAIVYLNAAKEGFWNPNWENHFPHGLLKKIQNAWKEAFLAMTVENGDRVPDLEADGPEGEYEDLHLPPEEKPQPATT